GGFVNSFEKDGFIFYGGVCALENASIIILKLCDLGITLEFLKIPVSVGIEDKFIFVDSKESLEQYKELLEYLISRHFFKGTPSFFALSYFYLYSDYIYPMGCIGILQS
ncbi:MAG: hypothetical protein ACPLPP_02655, partial [Caldisericum exile]